MKIFHFIKFATVNAYCYIWYDRNMTMAKDPVCGMFVEDKPDSIKYAKHGNEYFFCSSQCLKEFREPEKELKKLKIHVCSKYSVNSSDHIL